MQHKEKLPLESSPIYESALLERNRRLWEEIEKDDEKILRLAHRRPEGFNSFLMDMENSLGLYLSEDCIKNRGGQFLQGVEKLLAGLYKKVPAKTQEIVERMIDLILDYYSEEEKEHGPRTLNRILEQAGISRSKDKEIK